MTNLGMTKGEIIYQLVYSLNMGGDRYGRAIVIEAIEEYEKLVEENIIEELTVEKPAEVLNYVATHTIDYISSDNPQKSFRSNTMPKKNRSMIDENIEKVLENS